MRPVRRQAAIALGAFLAAATGVPAAAQNSGALGAAADSALKSGVRQYQALQYDSSIASLRRALAGTGGDTLSDSGHIRALSYMGAAQLFRGRRDSAFAAFRRLVVFNPRARPDPLVFPPEVNTIYDFAREATKVVRVDMPRDTSIRLGADRFSARLTASSFHQVIVALEREDGFTVKTLYAGPISDTLQVFWAGDDTMYLANDSGRLVFSVTSLNTTGRQGRVVRVPLDLVLGPQDTLPTPPPLPDSLFLPEKESAGKGLTALARGAGIGVAVALLPGLIASGDAPSGSRYVVAGSLSIAGLVGFLKHRPGRPLPDNIAANQALREGWQTQVQTTAQENVIRAQQKRLDIHAGRAEVIGGGQ